MGSLQEALPSSRMSKMRIPNTWLGGPLALAVSWVKKENLLVESTWEGVVTSAHRLLPPDTTSTSFAIADMGSGAYREDVITSRWWDAEARKLLMTAMIGKVKMLCSLLPREDEKTAIKYLKELPDLDMLFALRYRDQDFSREQHAAPPAFRIGVFADEG
ncbi:hypothetical protein DL95DRAFT_418942 [Leptodontidium sp. 2 PMI_412]|nr:hypothetical protein DL95DRAFT_418942 [Leptodontidium sp. 2 PMI_412]